MTKEELDKINSFIEKEKFTVLRSDGWGKFWRGEVVKVEDIKAVMSKLTVSKSPQTDEEMEEFLENTEPAFLTASDTADTLFKNEICRYLRGSVVYGTYEEGVSDRDWMIIVKDSCSDILDQCMRGIYQETIGRDDCQFIKESRFIEMLKNSEIEALECVFNDPEINDGKYLKIAEENLDKWNLRKSISAICSNSWVKCKKKLTVEKDYDLRTAQKSLWHSLRLYMFGIQIAINGKINDFSIANPLWDEISGSEDTSWEYYKEKYQGLFNTLRSDLVKLCNRPKNTDVN